METKLQHSTNGHSEQVAPPDAKHLLPAVFTVNSLSGKVRHLGSSGKIPLCGSRLFSPELSDFEIKYDDRELKEFWKGNCDGDIDKWVIVSEYEYCKRCLSVLNGR